MSVEKELDFINRNVRRHTRALANYQTRLSKIEELKTAFPDLQKVAGEYCSDSIEDKIEGMGVHHTWNGIYITFHVNFKTSTNKKVKILLKNKKAPQSKYLSYDNIRFKVADFKIGNRTYVNEKTCHVFNYESMIPANLKNKEKSIDKIKKTILLFVVKHKLTISEESFNFDYFQKLAVLG